MSHVETKTMEPSSSASHNRCYEVQGIVKGLRIPKDLDGAAEKLLELLSSDGQEIIRTDPEIFLQMVKKANCLIRSPFYMDIIEKMAAMYKTASYKTEEGPLECLLAQVERWENLLTNQMQLLALAQILTTADESVQSRTKCLRTFIMMSQYIEKSSVLKWSEELICTLKRLLEKGADPSWMPEVSARRDAYMNLSALSAFFLALAPLSVDNNLPAGTIELLPLFKCDKNIKSENHQSTALHALTMFNWDGHYSILKYLNYQPPPNFEQYKAVIYKVVELYPDFVDMANTDGSTPLHAFIGNITSHKNVLNNVLEQICEIAIVLRTETNINIQDTNGNSALHFLVGASDMFLQSDSQRCQQVFRALVKSFSSTSNIDMQNKYGYTPLHILSAKCNKLMLKQSQETVFEVFKCLTSDSNLNMQDHTGYTVLHRSAVLLPLFLQAGSSESQEAFLALIRSLISPLNIYMQDHYGCTPLHILADKCYECVPEESQETFYEVFKCLASKSSVDIQDKTGQTVLHLIGKKIYQDKSERQDLMKTLPCITTSKNVNTKDSCSVTPYSWIICGKLTNNQKPIFSKVEDIFLKSGASADLAEEGVTIIQLLDLIKELTEKIHTAEDLDIQGLKILELLTKCRQSIQESLPEVLLKMVKEANCLIRSAYYLEIIQKIVEEDDTIPRKSQPGPLLNLLQQFSDEKVSEVLFQHQEKLLKLIQILMKRDGSPQIRTRCLSILILNAEYGPFGGKLEWTDQLITAMAFLLDGGADPTWMPGNQDHDGSALYTFLERIIHILAHKNHLCDSLMALLPRFLTQACLDHREFKGPVTVLHALVKCDWKRLPESLPRGISQQYKEVLCQVIEANPVLLDMTDDGGRYPLQCFIHGITGLKDVVIILKDTVHTLKTETNINALDRNGQTVLHILASKMLDTGNEAFLEIYTSLNLASHRNIPDGNGQNVLHTLAKTLFEHPELGYGFITIFPLLTTEWNVNATDNDFVPPLSWILMAKACWINNDKDEKVFAEIEQLFLNKGAEADLAKAGMIVLMYRLAEEELANHRCTPERLQRLLCCLNALPEWRSLPDWKPYSYMQEFKQEVWLNLWGIDNARFIPTVMDILKILLTDESTAQHAWDSMMRYSGSNMTLSVMEILCLCAERGAQPTDVQLQKMLSNTNMMTRNEDLLVAFLKTLVVWQREKPFTFDLAFLGNFFKVGEEMLESGQQLVQGFYGTMENCLISGKLIDCFLAISQAHKNIPALEESLIEDSFSENWLKRNPLHLAVIFLRCENSLKCLPQNIIMKYINECDIHGCTPLHVAHLHHNEQAVQFLISYGAREDVADKFGKTPKALALSVVSKNGQSEVVTTDDHPVIKHYNLCLNVLEAKSGVLQLMRPMLVHSTTDTKALSGELKILMERLIKGTKFETAKIVITGSLRERLKAGLLDEGDIQLRFELNEYPFVDVTWKDSDFFKELKDSLTNNLATISWEGIGLRPISIHGPWKFLREGITIDLDVVPVLMGEEMANDIHKLQGELLNGNIHRVMDYCTLETWNIFKHFKSTYFAYEWDMIDSLPKSCRLAIVIAKALVHVYDWCKGDIRVKMPITSYMIKTAVFYILAYNSCDIELHSFREVSKILRDALESIEGKMSGFKTIHGKLSLNCNPEWTTDEDLDQHQEEARLWVWSIFSLIRYFAKKGVKLNSYWERGAINHMPIDLIMGFGGDGYICDACDYLLERLNPNTFYGS